MSISLRPTFVTNFVKRSTAVPLLIIYQVIQGVSEIRVLILTSERTRQFMKLFSKYNIL
jgi:hypothetical protein